MVPSSATRVAPSLTTSVAARMRSCSSCHCEARCAFTRRWIRTTSRARGLCSASVASAGSSRFDRSRCALDQCLLGGGMLRDRREQAAGLLGEHAPHGGRDHGRGDRAPAGRGQPGRREELREPVRGEEVDTDQPHARARHGAQLARTRGGAAPPRPRSCRVRRRSPGRAAKGPWRRAISVRNASAAARPYGEEATRRDTG